MFSLIIIVTGRVQGVSYRYFTKKHANKLGIKGYVINREDGSVEVVAQGEKKDLEKFVEKLRRGPLFSKVKSIGAREIEIGNLEDFKIR